MATIPQQLIEIAERAVKAGSKSGKECAAYTRKHAPLLAETHISHLFLAFKMVKRAAQFGPAIEAAKAGKPGTLAQLAKPYQGTAADKPPSGARKPGKSPPHGLPYGAGLDNALAEALGIHQPEGAPAGTAARRRRPDPPPNISQEVYAQFAQAVIEKARKASKK